LAILLLEILCSTKGYSRNPSVLLQQVNMNDEQLKCIEANGSFSMVHMFLS
jgi:hypothetical protein